MLEIAVLTQQLATWWRLFYFKSEIFPLIKADIRYHLLWWHHLNLTLRILYFHNTVHSQSMKSELSCKRFLGLKAVVLQAGQAGLGL